jgi:hypothetical protein
VAVVIPAQKKKPPGDEPSGESLRMEVISPRVKPRPDGGSECASSPPPAPLGGCKKGILHLNVEQEPRSSKDFRTVSTETQLHSWNCWGVLESFYRAARASCPSCYLPATTSVMPRPPGKRSPLEAEVAEEIRAARHRQQDEDFRRALLGAVYAGTESCPLSVSTEPSTKKPILNYRRPD